MPRRTGVYWPMACAATGAAHPQRRLPRKVIQAGRDERTLLRFSRISIARCADLVRSSAYAWGPLSQVSPPHHGSARHGPTSLRTGPSAGRRRQYGRTAAAGGGEREPAIMAVPAADAEWRAVRVPGMAGTWRGISAGGTGDLLDLVPDDGTDDLVRQRRGGSEPLSAACECPAALSGSRSRLNRRVLPVRRPVESDAPDGCTREGMDGRALVLGGGGVTGIAWEIGVIAGLAGRVSTWPQLT